MSGTLTNSSRNNINSSLLGYALDHQQTLRMAKIKYYGSTIQNLGEPKKTQVTTSTKMQIWFLEWKENIGTQEHE